MHTHQRNSSGFPSFFRQLIRIQSCELIGNRAFVVLILTLSATTAVIILWVFPVSFILGTHPFWKNPEGDLVQHMTGASYYAAGPWRLPLFFVPDLGIPEGTNIIFTDSIPLQLFSRESVIS